jgi:hypothetical protein
MPNSSLKTRVLEGIVLIMEHPRICYVLPDRRTSVMHSVPLSASSDYPILGMLSYLLASHYFQQRTFLVP